MTPQETPTLRHLPPLAADPESVRDLSPFSLDPEVVIASVSQAPAPKRPASHGRLLVVVACAALVLAAIALLARVQ